MGPQVLEIDFGHGAVLPLLQGWQYLRDRSLTTFGRGQRLRQGAAPARLDDLFTHRTQGLAGAVEVGLGAVVFVVGQELRQVAGANQGVDRLVLGRQTRRVAGRRSGDDTVVGTDLGIVPGA
ncbi:hypothetical protein D3C77_228160 [compost metagenome]